MALRRREHDPDGPWASVFLGYRGRVQSSASQLSSGDRPRGEPAGRPSSLVVGTAAVGATSEEPVSPELALVDSALRERLVQEEAVVEDDPFRRHEPASASDVGPIKSRRTRRRSRVLVILIVVLLLGAAVGAAYKLHVSFLDASTSVGTSASAPAATGATTPADRLDASTCGAVRHFWPGFRLGARKRGLPLRRRDCSKRHGRLLREECCSACSSSRTLATRRTHADALGRDLPLVCLAGWHECCRQPPRSCHRRDHLYDPAAVATHSRALWYMAAPRVELLPSFYTQNCLISGGHCTFGQARKLPHARDPSQQVEHRSRR